MEGMAYELPAQLRRRPLKKMLTRRGKTVVTLVVLLVAAAFGVAGFCVGARAIYGYALMVQEGQILEDNLIADVCMKTLCDEHLQRMLVADAEASLQTYDYMWKLFKTNKLASLYGIGVAGMWSFKYE